MLSLSGKQPFKYSNAINVTLMYFKTCASRLMLGLSNAHGLLTLQLMKFEKEKSLVISAYFSKPLFLLFLLLNYSENKQIVLKQKYQETIKHVCIRKRGKQRYNLKIKNICNIHQLQVNIHTNESHLFSQQTLGEDWNRQREMKNLIISLEEFPSLRQNIEI